MLKLGRSATLFERQQAGHLRFIAGSSNEPKEQFVLQLTLADAVLSPAFEVRLTRVSDCAAVQQPLPRSHPMRAIVLDKFGGLDSLVIKEIPEPEPKAGYVVIEVKAFGINHAETHKRRGEWAEVAPLSGIECVGLVKSCPGGEFPVGAKVAALMGGLGRTINGSYAEYTRAPVSNVALIEAELRWAELAAIPKTYATAWTCRFRNLGIEKGQLLVIRGATFSFGPAALKMAVRAGVRVIATTRNRDRFAMPTKLGAERCEIERRDLSKHISEAKKIDGVARSRGQQRHARLPSRASPSRPILPGRLVRGAGSDPRFQPIAANGKRRLPDILRKLCFRNAGISPFGRATSANRCRCCGGPTGREAY
jgi:D-arabinose 1-dehydrogenase-like Zn-dependent alcohol dehydrogenase